MIEINDYCGSLIRFFIAAGVVVSINKPTWLSSTNDIESIDPSYTTTSKMGALLRSGAVPSF